MMARRKKKKQQRIRKSGKPIRNLYALIAHLRTGSGRHPNLRNLARKKACRGKVKEEQS